MIKAAFFDIDGTLFSHTMHKIPDSARKAIHLLREKGVKIFLAIPVQTAKNCPL